MTYTRVRYGSLDLAGITQDIHKASAMYNYLTPYRDKEERAVQEFCQHRLFSHRTLTAQCMYFPCLSVKREDSAGCYRLKVCVLPNVLTPVFLEVGPWAEHLGRCLGQEGGALMSEISVLIKKTPENLCSPSAMWGHSKRMAISEPESGLSPDIESTDA